MATGIVRWPAARPARTTPQGPERICASSFIRGVQLVQDGAGFLIIGIARVGQPEMAGGAFQKPHAEPFFKLADMAAQGGFGLAQRPCGGGKTLVFHYGSEKGDVVQVLHGGASKLVTVPNVEQSVPFQDLLTVRWRS